MKNLLTPLFVFFTLALFGQLDTMIVYDLASKTYEVILPVNYDASITSDKTPSNMGTLDGFTSLTNAVPTQNLFPDTDFTRLTRTKDSFDLTHYPMRTSVKIGGMTNSGNEISCSGTLVAENMVITAAHCTFDYFGNIEFYVENIEIFPSFDNGIVAPNLPTSSVSKIFLTKKTFDGDSFFDVCLLLLEDPIGTSLGYQGLGFAPVDVLQEKVYHKMSYPATSSSLDPNEVYNGDTTYYNYGLMSLEPFFGFLELDSPNVTGIPGQSGSGLFESIDQDQTVYGVMTYNNYQHFRITPNYFYQLKNILDGYEVVSSLALAQNTEVLRVYPNPFVNFTTINLPNDLSDVVKYELIDLNGRTVQHENIIDQNFTLQRNSLASGIYVLSILLKNGQIITERIVIQ